MNNTERKAAAKKFAEYWQDKGYEKGQGQKFWIELLQKVYGIETPTHYIEFEEQVKMDHTAFIDGYIPETRVLIEQKSSDRDLRKAIKQSDGTFLTPFQQAKRYIVDMPVDKHPRWVITCNFQQFLVYDMNRPTSEPEEILLKDLPKEFYRLDFLVKNSKTHLQKELEVSVQAGELVGLLYDALIKQYKEPEDPVSLRSLNMLCVRLVFCLYAEDAGLFGHKGMFSDYMSQFPAKLWRSALRELFIVLDTKEEERDRNLEDELMAFPYVNGGLFSDESIEIPVFTDEIVDLIINKASENFNWSEISPTIFGAVFESTLNPETRRSGGMHYTSIENIHKVIDPLFLDDLKAEFEQIRQLKVERTRVARLKEFQEKLAGLTFLDPACGSGNFLTETYLSLRRLENAVLTELFGPQVVIGNQGKVSPIKVNIGQFYGIEINDFAVTVAKTALWIAEAQMMAETESIVHMILDYFPLDTNAFIVEGNALRMEWETIIPKTKLNYIMGNPPFVGAMRMKGSKREDVVLVFPECKKPGEIDYVAGWYVKAAKLIQGTNIKCAFVSTNSICQGQQVALLWKPLIEKYGVEIIFAYQTFKWESESRDSAAVHCIIVGFSIVFSGDKRIFSNGQCKIVRHINAYLAEADDVFIESSRKQISGMPLMHMGSMARDGGFLILSKEEYEEYVGKEPQGKRFIHRYMMGREFINNIDRYCFWLLDVDPSELRKCPLLLRRLDAVKQHRLNSPAKETRVFAETPGVFCQLAQPSGNFIAFPKVSSEQRKYIPIGFLTDNIIVGDKIYVVENVGLYHFGILTSNVHNAWMRVVCGRLEMRYSYSNTIVYNNFPWPKPTAEQMSKIEVTAQAILDARALYPECSLADLYGDKMDLLYPELVKAHQNNDRAVMEAYGFTIVENGKRRWLRESETVAELMKMYQELVQTIEG